ncbi:hypothetical protein B5X24_HaOG216901 [Helicoverpa armigera]|uniref:MD-2-related lipid-recognition domain-containing protein n=1 Tax=Helicoverpa armigera TaxID=29058 RepID=A0A2W1C279_HELAM|nr:hypothetical protein B5X24_HaOG216901 [Helicoverpa armigera]
MNHVTLCLSVFFIYFTLSPHYCLKVIPERVQIDFYNKTFVEETPVFNVRRYSRKGSYVVNLEFVSKLVIDNTQTVDVLFYEYLHNEYRRSFPELHMKLCDLINKDIYFGHIMRDAGFKTCPILPGKYAIHNISFHHDFPYVWPFDKGMAEISLQNHQNSVMVAKGKVYITFKQEKS